MRTCNILAIVVLLGYASSYPTDESITSTEVGLVYTLDDSSNNSEKKKDSDDDDVISALRLKSMHVYCDITNRYAHTVISSKYANPANKSQDATFSVVLPDTAFISGFIMEIKGKQYKAYVEEKKEAKRIYDQAVASGLGAAHVEVDARDSNRFTVSMNVEPHDKVVFNLTYEQLLIRRLSKYEMVINLHPGQLVKDLSVDVFINETKPLLKVGTPALRSGNEIVEDTETKNPFADVKILNEENTAAHIHFAPSVKEQKEMALMLEKEKPTDNGISGQFVVEYDVERDPAGGQVLVSDDGYFVHFFAPNQLKPITKHVVFVLDVSGSMHGRKLEQVKQAMQVILGQLSPTDYFNLVEFSFGAKVWNLENITDSPRFESSSNYRNWWRPENEKPKENQTLPPAFPATSSNIATAKKIIEEMESNGGTNIYDALSTAVNITNAGVPVKNTLRPIIIFLTDGDATDGETDSTKIIEMVDAGNIGEEKAALFTLAFGSDANKDFLKKISLKNNGFMRHIYEAADASLQLQDFYKTISSPLLANIKFIYSTIEANSLTKHKFHTLFDGGELIVAGKMNNQEKPEEFKVHALTLDGPIDFPPQIIKWVPRSNVIGELERLWAYISIRQLLDEATTKDEKESSEKKRALELALKYNFVTSITSLVVVKPNETKAVETEEAHSADKQFNFASSGYRLSAPAMAGFAGGFGGGLAGPVSFASPIAQFAPMRAASYSPPQPVFQRYDAADYDSDLVVSSRIPILTTTIKPFLYTTEMAKKNTITKNIQDLITDLTWLSGITQTDNPDILKFNNKLYHIGNNETMVEEKTCELISLQLSGNCTLLSACPSIYSKIPDLDAYKQYFCSLESDKYAGVCCILED